ncbi:MAG: hypothetical protein NTY01_05460 [Verrucomicrobia bacterium]|nr:hypothetical protein [Verrucomicrobiota bacterium]
MKTINFLSLAAAALLAGSNIAGAMNDAAVNEVIKLQNAGFAEDTIVSYIKGKNINYDISADDAISLKQRGVSAAVLNVMLASGGSASAPMTPSPAPVPQVQPSSPVAVPSPQIVAQPVVAAQPAYSSDVGYFYQELSPHGRWIRIEDNQWYWQPNIVVSNRSWRPYWDGGHWVNSDHGWYWASDYPWGWAAFHYGRWHLHPHHGWIWYPDRVWGPAWVAWRSGGEYCGWAPLPPHADFDVAAGCFMFRGRRVEASFDFGLDWNHFSFCFVKEMGERPREHFHREADVRRVFGQTTVVNNYTINKTVVTSPGKGTVVYSGRESRPSVVNRGIDPERVASGKGRAVEQVKIQDLRTPPPNRSHERYDAGRKTMEVYRPKVGDPSRPW